MFDLPQEGIGISTNEHNCNYDIIADWIEGNILFNTDKYISKNDIIDILLEQSIYIDQDFASDFISDVWDKIIFRHSSLRNNQIFEISANRIKRNISWKNFPSYSFCLAISLKTFYNLSITSPTNFINMQGEIFEQISFESLKVLFPNWELHLAGWSSMNKKKFTTLLSDLTTKFNFLIQETSPQYYTARQNDAKLDIILARKFHDNFCNIPIILIQCASGANWISKRGEPSIELWEKIVNFNSKPIKGLSIPFSLDKKQSISHSPYINGVVFDRMRMLSAFSISKKYIDGPLKKRINDFTDIIVNKIPILN